MKAVDSCPSGHPLEEAVRGLLFCESCREVYSSQGGEPVWHACPFTSDLAGALLAERRRSYLLREALRSPNAAFRAAVLSFPEPGPASQEG
jgi:hypothetical protein